VSTDPTRELRRRINRLWLMLAGFLVLGATGAATVAYGVSEALAGQLWQLFTVPLGLVRALLSVLFIAGLLYRVDRYRGATERRIALFE
jgi:hypothetical protein